MFLVFRARLQTLDCRLNEVIKCIIKFNNIIFLKAIQTYEYAISCQNDWKNLHHVKRLILFKKLIFYFYRLLIGKFFGVMCKLLIIS